MKDIISKIDKDTFISISIVAVLISFSVWLTTGIAEIRKDIDTLKQRTDYLLQRQNVIREQIIPELWLQLKELQQEYKKDT